jgi:hypothetical protein
MANEGLTPVAVIFNGGAGFIDQGLLLHRGHKKHLPSAFLTLSL